MSRQWRWKLSSLTCPPSNFISPRISTIVLFLAVFMTSLFKFLGNEKRRFMYLKPSYLKTRGKSDHPHGAVIRVILNFHKNVFSVSRKAADVTHW